MKNLLNVAIGIVVLSFCACNNNVNINNDLAEIEKTREQLITSMNNDDVHGIMNALSENHITLSPDEPAYVDEEKLKAYHEARIDLLNFKAKFVTEDIQLSGDWAFEYFTNESVVTPKDGGNSSYSTGKGLWIWHREKNDDWKLSRSIWNSNEPANTVNSADNVEIRFDVRGEGEPALVFVHGWSRHREDWKDQLTHFSKNHKVVSIDLAGFGDSGNNRRDWTMAAFGEDLVAVIKKLHIEKAILIGHSMGTPVIIKAAHQIPDKIVGLVPVDMLHDVGEKKTADQLETMKNDYMAMMVAPDEERVRSWFVSEIDNDIVEEFCHYYANVKKQGWKESIHSTFSWMSDMQEADLKITKAPIICINSDLRIPNAEFVKQYAPAFEYKIIKGIGHMVMWDAPNKFNMLLEDCIKEFSSVN